jgi:predicted CoA-substrate-specific enzyme activase
VGSTQTKAVLLDAAGSITATAIIETGCDIAGAAGNAYAALLKASGRAGQEVLSVAGTGYGRFRIEFGDIQITEISCHARGAVHLFPDTRTVLDMGGQDNKAIRVAADGGVIDFCMNDKCAAGTGRFLSAAAALLGIPMEELAAVALSGTDPVEISTTCTVFAESEILAWIARGRQISDILLGVHQAIAARFTALVRRVGLEGGITFTGGVSRNDCMVGLIGEMLGRRLNVGARTPFAGALGAALFARDRLAGRSFRQQKAAAP